MEMTRKSSQKRIAKMHNISMQPVFSNALTALASRAGHKNISRIVQELIAREAIFQFGSDWTERLSEDEQEEQEAA